MRTLSSAAIALAIISAADPAFAQLTGTERGDWISQLKSQGDAPLVRAHLTYLAADDPINLWLGRQYNMQGGHCCESSHAHLYYGAYTINPDGSFTIPLPDGGEVVVPKERQVRPNADDPNPTGTAVLWYNTMDFVFCIAPGDLT